MKRIVYTILLLFVAVANITAGEQVGPTKITKITLDPNGMVYLKVAAATPNLNCPNNAAGNIQFNTSTTHFDKQYALLLAAYMANKQVVLELEGCGHFPYLKQSIVHD